VIATKGEYAGWRATRATGDFDLRTFAIGAYPVDKIDGLWPGMRKRRFKGAIRWRIGLGVCRSSR
jgi:hypothetical protein